LKDSRPFIRVIDRVEWPYGTLLSVLAIMLVVYPFLGTHKYLGVRFDSVMLGVVVVSLKCTFARGPYSLFEWSLGLLTFGAGLLSRSLGVVSAYPFSAGLRGLFFSYLIVKIFHDIFKRDNITFDAVMGASCVLVLLGLAFGSFFTLLEWLVPGSFIIPPVPSSIEAVFGPTSDEFSLVYFSFVALTTIGFGHIYPVAPPARSLAVLEGLISQLYLAIIIARLVGLELVRRDNTPPGGNK